MSSLGSTVAERPVVGTPGASSPSARRATPSLSAEVRPVAWKAVRSEASSRTLVISYQVGGCFWHGNPVVEETNDSVTISVALTSDAGQGAACNGGMAERKTTVTLKEPLGSRTLRHASLDSTAAH